ncbi:MAG TPA: hypothetical protein VFR66_00505 [Burkholderiales bacterium]|nr:hypothetical protein [Burkholderiales bacterium]
MMHEAWVQAGLAPFLAGFVVAAGVGHTLLASFYTLACGGAAAATAYVASRGWPSWLQ